MGRGHGGTLAVTQGRTALASPKYLQPSPHWDESVPRGPGRHLSPCAGNPGTCRGMIPGEARRACPADVKALPRPGEGGVHREGDAGRGEGAACTQRAGEGTGVGGAYLWDKQRQDSDRMGQSLGLCLLRLILVLRAPHRGLLAAACPRQALHCSAGNSHPSWGHHGAPGIILQLCTCGNPEKGGNTSECCHPPHHGHFPPTLTMAPSAKATTNPARSGKKRTRRCSRHSGHGQHPQASSPSPPHVQQRHLKPPSLRWHSGVRQGSSTRGSSCPAAAPARAQPRPRHHRGNNAHRNSTYSGSLLHNNRHLTQGSPDFTDSEKGGERGGEKTAQERGVRGMGETEPDQH